MMRVINININIGMFEKRAESEERRGMMASPP